MPSPEVLTGLRAPRTVRLEEQAKRDAERGQGRPLIPVGDPTVTVYVSNSRSYLVEVQNVPSYTHEGQRYPAKRIAAQFENGVYRNGAPGTPGHRDPKVRKLIDEVLQRNRYFGRFGDVAAHFWLASDQNATTEAAALASALKTLKSLPPAVVEAHIAALRQGDAEDHAMPPAESPAKGVRPIPPAA